MRDAEREAECEESTLSERARAATAVPELGRTETRLTLREATSTEAGRDGGATREGAREAALDGVASTEEMPVEIGARFGTCVD